MESKGMLKIFRFSCQILPHSTESKGMPTLFRFSCKIFPYCMESKGMLKIFRFSCQTLLLSMESKSMLKLFRFSCPILHFSLESKGMLKLFRFSRKSKQSINGCSHDLLLQVNDSASLLSHCVSVVRGVKHWKTFNSKMPMHKGFSPIAHQTSSRF